MPWRQFNPNPDGNRVGDCPVRAIAAVIQSDWDTAYWLLAIEGAIIKDMPNADRTWGSYLTRLGFVRRLVAPDCAVCYTVRNFAMEHPVGTYVLGVNEHVIAVRDGDYWDSFDSGDETPIFYWTREEGR